MGFHLQYYYDGFMPYFTFPETVTNEEMNEFLGVLQSFLNSKKKFVFIVDARQVQFFSPKAAMIVIGWMKKNRSNIPGVLLASGIVTKSKNLSDTLNYVFTKQPPVSPNKTTNDITEAIEFVESYIPTEQKIEKEQTYQSPTQMNPKIAS